MTEPIELATRISVVIGNHVTRGDDDHAVGNPLQVAGQILADPDLCAAIGNHAAEIDPHNVLTQLDAINVLRTYLDQHPDLDNWRRLRSDLGRLEAVVHQQFADDVDLGAAYLALADQPDDYRNPATVGGLIRAAIAKTGATLTPGPKAEPATPQEF